MPSCNKLRSSRSKAATFSRNEGTLCRVLYFLRTCIHSNTITFRRRNQTDHISAPSYLTSTLDAAVITILQQLETIMKIVMQFKVCMHAHQAWQTEKYSQHNTFLYHTKFVFVLTGNHNIVPAGSAGQSH